LLIKPLDGQRLRGRSREKILVSGGDVRTLHFTRTQVAASFFKSRILEVKLIPCEDRTECGPMYAVSLFCLTCSIKAFLAASEPVEACASI
jgi:hypothetical protein